MNPGFLPPRHQILKRQRVFENGYMQAAQVEST